MVYSEHNKYVFVAVPKTGSMTLTKGLTQFCRGMRVAQYHGWQKACNYPDDILRFLVVRHPVARVLSWWWHSVANRPTSMKGWTFLRYVEQIIEWRDNGTPEGDVPELYQTQAQWVERVEPDVILKYEELPGAFAGLPFSTTALARWWGSKRLNDSGIRCGTRDRLTEADWQAVIEYCPDDFEPFGYASEYILP